MKRSEGLHSCNPSETLKKGRIKRMKQVALYHGIDRYCVFENGYHITKIFTSRKTARLYSIIHHIKFSDK